MKYAPWCLMAFLFMTGIVHAEEEAPPDIQRYIDVAKKLPDGVNETVWQMLTEAGRTEGFRGGKAQRAWELRQALTARGTELDQLYQFAPLISRQGWLPPVIASAGSLATITDKQMRTAQQTYRLLRPERFVSNPPGWRQYLFAGLTTTARPDDSVIPRNSAEREVWTKAVRQGWEEGRKSADETLTANFNRLTRDYTGMMRYTQLARQNMITPPVVTEQHQSVTGTRSQLMLGDRVRDLKQPAGFELDKKRWVPQITVGE
ncbi:type IV secretory system conjugative DNA transfer family protein [Escherichia coli]|uniref:type IV secretory system conjugative DNA transfer family protein n=1 Tax=Escherichia coli TaxID=562 RepID=UPI0007751559|nr:type IV secretory system conjugative DNA transfer family protein [Escherichia coli]EFU0742468.1 type IV secretion system DotC family protein [Escherichia coli]KXR86563.1 conjugal transfer protein [Escherichia coli]MBB8114174.1 type IV secretory system conjugative DNA transfer family protein [Escherichia coli]MDI0737986.1 type IV secretion system DotC family protein [Escherichia coli]OAC03191.1 lipoprotein [Escherichia coli]